MKGFLANYRRQLEEIIPKTTDPEAQSAYRKEIEIIDSGPRLAPDVVVSTSGKQTIGGRDLSIGLERYAVTAGDIWILDPASGVLVSGDLVTLPAPFLDTACPAQWKESLDRLAKTDFDLLIPGHGPPLTRRQFNVYRHAFDELLVCGGSEAPKDACIDGWISGVAALVPEKQHDFTRKVMAYYVDVLRRAPAETAKLCGKQ
jgi:glyoxylase-like metal-dependent hydrolase (beta-lactamase superfamily II)